jgi:hypothetical protein
MGHHNANAENNQSPRQSRKHSYLPRRPEVERREGCTVKIIQELRWISQPTVELASRPIQVCCNSENLISALRFRELVVAIEHLSDESVFGALRQHARTDSGRHWCGKPPLSPWRPSKTVDGAFARGLGPTLADISRLSFGAARCGGAQARRISMRGGSRENQWTPQQDDRLRSIILAGHPPTEIPLKPHRSTALVYARAHSLGLSLKRLKLRPRQGR